MQYGFRIRAILPIDIPIHFYTGGSSRHFFFGGGRFGKGSKLGHPKTKNSTDLGHYFLGVVQFHFRKIKKMSYLSPARGSPKITENMAEVGTYFMKKKNVRLPFFNL